MKENSIMKKLTKENLLELGFKEEFVPAEESGDKSFTYYVFEMPDAFNKPRCVLITNSDDEAHNGEFVVEFFNTPEIGVFEEYDDLQTLINLIKKVNK